MAARNEIRPGWRGHSTTEAVTVLLRVMRFLYLYQNQNIMAVVRVNTEAVARI